jgi:hypothetical protein
MTALQPISIHKLQYLNECYEYCWIGRGGPHALPSPFARLVTPRFPCVGYMKNVASHEKSRKRNGLLGLIMDIAVLIRENREASTKQRVLLLVGVDRRFRGAYCFIMRTMNHQGDEFIALIMEGGRTSETSVNSETTRRYIPEGSNSPHHSLSLP